MNNKLFVGNLDYTLTDADLEKAFSKFGTVLEAKVITDMQSRRSKGFGFVTFEKAEDAAEAIKELNEKELNGRKIFVSEARSKDRE
ncbi:RNA-binding protein [candidate division WWE3 bacterium CG10_big_fil_rev_8_21_14_0_10_32_10]|uniref:RNA-binding protein n=1 Tax=candidate division WWE3 bacterium CG10_big_fil_rev_8_21_14_0_10_32_10 TaxID=1975090 RepID=A0A2H0RA58_UNCKA|nr:MAG: RNA-binding protein [candidate division WWE3 bacterium CG10_big_fil_rev_8_21_14_0_10_32_10]